MADEQTDTPNPAVIRVLHAMTDRLHESLCNCRKYPDECASKAQYRRDELVHTLTYAEDALDVAVEQGWAPPAERDAETTALRTERDALLARDAAWKAHAADLTATLAEIECVAWRGVDKGEDVAEEIYQTMTPRLPAVLADPAPSTPAAQETPA